MTTISPEKVIDSSAYVQDALTVSKRLALMALAAKWRRVDPANVRGTMAPLLPEIEQLMHEQQALGRQIGWTQGELAAAVATGADPGSISLPVDAAREGRLRGGPPFANALQRAIPGALARISSGVRPDAAVADAGRMVALQLGSIAHDEARLVTQDLVMARGGGAAPRMGYARKAEGAHTCDFCRTLATRGPVYSADTAGFRAHRFCDCTTYAVPIEIFEVNPDDWVAYQRWASTSAHSAVRAAQDGKVLDPVPRIQLVESQIASYEPIVAAGNGTEWMRNKLNDLYAERSALVRSSGESTVAGFSRLNSLITDMNYVRSHPFLSTEIRDLPVGTPYSNPEKRLARKLTASHYYYNADERIGVVVPAKSKIKPEHLAAFNQKAVLAVREARPDLMGLDDVIVFDLQSPVPQGALACTTMGSNRIQVSRRILSWSDPEVAARASGSNGYGPHWSVSTRAGTSLDATLLHELGHDADASAVGSALGFGTGYADRVDSLYRRWIFDAIDETDEETIDAIRRLRVTGAVPEIVPRLLTVHDGPTLYARTSPAEMYAEAYAAWRMRARVELPPGTLEWAREFAEEFQWS